jgi:2-dehydro-3-deoxy-D-pentonate aldolase
VTSTPYYFPAGQPELVEFMQHLVPDLPLPLFLYNMPMMTKVSFEHETLRRLIQLPGIAGLKDSSGDLSYFANAMDIVRDRPDWSILVGPEHLLATTMRMGGHGGVNGGANICPRLFVDLYEAIAKNDGGREREAQARLEKLGQIYKVGRHASAVIKGMKCAANLLGLCDDFMAEPFARFRDPERQKVREVLQQLNLLK